MLASLYGIVYTLERWNDSLIPQPLLSASIAVVGALAANGFALAAHSPLTQERHLGMATLFQALSAVAGAVMLLGQQMAEINTLFRWLPTTASFLPMLWLLLIWSSGIRSRAHPGVAPCALALILSFSVSLLRSVLASSLSPCNLGWVYPEPCYSYANMFGTTALFSIAILLWWIVGRCIFATVGYLAASKRS